MNETAATIDPKTEQDQIAALHLRWMNALVRNEGDPNLDFRSDLGDLYDFESPDVVLYDDFDPERRVARSADEYAAIWEPVFASVHTTRHAVSDGPHVLTGEGSLAASWLQFNGRVRMPDGGVLEFLSTSSMVFHRTGSGWRIAREHNSTVVLPTGTLDPVFGPV